MRLLSSPHRTYKTHFAIRHESQIARRMVVPAASTDPLATSPYAFSIAFCAYNTHFATRHESPIARRMVVQTASTDPLATSSYAPSQQSTSYLQDSLCNSTRISNCTKNGSTSSLHRSTCDLTVCVQHSLLCLQYSLCNSTRISNCTKNGSTNSLHRSTCDLLVCAFSAVHIVPTRLTLQFDTNLKLHEEW